MVFTNISCFVLAMSFCLKIKALGKMLQEKNENWKKVCGLCTDVEVKLIKMRDRKSVV